MKCVGFLSNLILRTPKVLHNTVCDISTCNLYYRLTNNINLGKLFRLLKYFSTYKTGMAISHSSWDCFEDQIAKILVSHLTPIWKTRVSYSFLWYSSPQKSAFNTLCPRNFQHLAISFVLSRSNIEFSKWHAVLVWIRVLFSRSQIQLLDWELLFIGSTIFIRKRCDTGQHKIQYKILTVQALGGNQCSAIPQNKVVKVGILTKQ